jgi:predicted DNA-binding ribbon-helix-helix protein
MKRGNSQVRKRAVRLYGRKTSASLEDAFWDALHEIAAAQGSSIGSLFAAIDSERRERQHTNLSSAVRLFVLDYYRSRCGLDQPRSSGDPC